MNQNFSFGQAYRHARLLDLACPPDEVSLHESGHGVVALLLGMGCTRIEVNDEFYPGEARIEPYPRLAERLGDPIEAGRRFSIAVMAGALAAPGTGLSPEDSWLVTAARLQSGVDDDVFFDRWTCEAAELVEANRELIELVAGCLQGRGVLFEEELDTLIRCFTPREAPAR
jgi:hypothetical protein